LRHQEAVIYGLRVVGKMEV